MRLEDIFDKWSTYIIIILSFFALVGSASLLNRNVIPYQGKKKSFTLHVPSGGDSYFKMLQNTETGINFNVTVSGAFPSAADVKLSRICMVTFNHNPKLMLWILIFSIAVSASCGIFLPVVYHITALSRKFKPKWYAVLLILIAIVVVVPWAITRVSQHIDHNYFSAFDIISHFHVLFTDVTVINNLIMFMIMVGVIAIFGMMLVNYCITKVNLPEESKRTKKLKKAEIQAISDSFSFLSAKLKFFLSVISVLILFSVITTTLIQQALNQVVELKDFELFPSEFIYSYGLIFSLFLSVIYIPVYYHLKMKGESLIRSLDVQEDEKEKYESLKLNDSVKDNVRMIVVLISPFLGSIFTELLKNITF